MESFVCKFKNLQYAGYKATLTLEAENGEAFVTLKACLGGLPPPPPGYQGRGYVPPVHRPPAYFRRQARRRKAAEAAEQEDIQAEKAHDKVCDDVSKEASTVDVLAEEAIGNEDDKDVNKEVNSLATVAEEAIGNPDENDLSEKTNFECPICDFCSNFENGLKVHLARKHSKVEQLDGHYDEDPDDDEYAGSKHFWKNGWLGGAFQSFCDANKVLDACDISQEEKRIIKAEILEARKIALGSNFMYYPPWDKS